MPDTLTDAHYDWSAKFTGIDPRASRAGGADPGDGQPAPADAAQPPPPAQSADAAAPADGASAPDQDQPAGQAPPAQTPDQDAPEGAASGGAAADQPADGSDQQDQAAGASLVSDPNFEKLIEAMEADGDDADATWKSQLGDKVFDLLAPEVHAQYKADGEDCDKARGDFDLEWNKIVAGKGSAKKLLAAYDIFSLRIGALQMANARIDALIAADFATKIAPFLTFVMKVKKFQLAEQFQRRLQKLMADLDKAETAVTKAEVKLALNVAVTALTTIVAPEATIAKVCLAGGGMVAHVVIDRSLGEGTVTGTVVFVAGDGGEFVELSERGKEAIEKLKGGSKTIGVAAGAITAALDANDVFEGKEVVEKIRTEIEDTQKAFDELLAGVLPLQADFIMLDKLIQSLPDIVNKALAAGNDAAKNYDAIKQEIQKAMQEGS